QRQQDLLMAAQQRQLRLARAAEEARLRAEQIAAAQAAGDRQRWLAQRQQAAEDMLRRAPVMVQTKRFTIAIQLFEGAASLRPNDDAIYRELALAGARAAETARADLAEAQARREAELRRVREAQLAEAQRQLAAERDRRAQEDAARRRFTEERDRREYQALMDLAQ